MHWYIYRGNDMSTTTAVAISSIDSDIHKAIDVIQACVLRLEELKRVDLGEEQSKEKISKLIRSMIECGNLLHDARKDIQIVP